MKNAALTWEPVSNCLSCETVEFGTRDEVYSIYKTFPSSVRAYEGRGEIRDRVNHCNIAVHVCSVPDGHGGTRLLAYPMQMHYEFFVSDVLVGEANYLSTEDYDYMADAAFFTRTFKKPVDVWCNGKKIY